MFFIFSKMYINIKFASADNIDPGFDLTGSILLKYFLTKISFAVFRHRQLHWTTMFAIFEEKNSWIS